MVDLLGQDGTIRIDGVHGVNVEITLAPALILFGPNDAGKTNIVRLISSLLRGRKTQSRDPFRDRYIGDDSVEGHVTLAFDFERPDHRELLLIAARKRHDGRERDYPVFTVEGEFRAEDRDQGVQGAEEDDEPEAEFVIRNLRNALIERLARSATSTPHPQVCR